MSVAEKAQNAAFDECLCVFYVTVVFENVSLVWLTFYEVVFFMAIRTSN